MKHSGKIFILVLTLAFMTVNKAEAQENPPVPIEVEVSTVQFLNFGAFAVGNSIGTVSVDSNGTRTWTGDATLLNTGATVSPALFDVYANPGTLINISHAPSFTLSGTSGQTIELKIDSYSTGKTFITNTNSQTPTPVYVGGTLNLGAISANGPGAYSGSFTITFIQE
ncbi:DUF4402 domain-containing protein [Gramella sp. MAR_2010_147]|uniref:DUF4402 domain-containing protein n=1 Tax=Gramella sp. MAR_2010_147 TaxID=1250205 RepID=UPI0012FD0DD5|nr:DUF4402 domain-containing protein [Gramella sp. MAR_2010_147]